MAQILDPTPDGHAPVDGTEFAMIPPEPHR